MDNDSLSVISDYDCEDGATTIQKHWRRQAAKVFFSRWKPMLIFRTSRRKHAVVVQRRWIRNRRKRNAVVALQAHARRKYLWGVNGECSDTVLKVFELRNVIGFTDGGLVHRRLSLVVATAAICLLSISTLE